MKYILNSDGELDFDSSEADIFEMLYVLELKEKDMLTEDEFDMIVYGED